MKLFLDCLPCLLRQVLEVSRRITDNIETQEKILIDSIKIISNYKKYRCAPLLAHKIHNIAKKYTGNFDPYYDIKKQDIKSAKQLYNNLLDFMEKQEDNLLAALKISATGNIIDSAVYSNLDIKSCIEVELSKDFTICDIDLFRKKLKTAKHIVILGDNSGETVFDKILCEYLKDYNITYVVRSEPIINDATVIEAEESGLNDCAQIVSSGCGSPGVILEKCNKEFLDIFYSADIVISKGQGNYEALSNSKRGIFYLLKVKCPMVAKDINSDINGYVFKYIEN